MKINELLVESSQLDEGPFTQAIGKGAGKVAKGIANIGKDLKTGFKAGYADQSVPATTKPAVQSSTGDGGFIDQFKKGFAQGQKTSSLPAAKSATGSTATGSAAEPQVAAQSKIGIAQINKIIPTLRTRDLLSLRKNIDAVIAKKSTTEPTVKQLGNRKKAKPDQTTIDADRERLISKVADSVERYKQNMLD